MKREHLFFLFGGFAFGILFGFGLFNAIENRPDLDANRVAAVATEPPRPQGPMAPTQGGGPAAGAGAGAPMMAEINRLKQRLAADPKDLAALTALADLYYEVGMWQDAAGYYERAITIDPKEPNLLTDLGICYRYLRDFDRALAQFDRAHEIDPRHWQSLFNKVVVATFDVRRFDLALDALESMEAIEPRPPELSAGRLQELRQALERARGAGTVEGRS